MNLFQRYESLTPTDATLLSVCLSRVVYTRAFCNGSKIAKGFLAEAFRRVDQIQSKPKTKGAR